MLGGTFPTGFSKRDTILHCQHYHSIVFMENLTFLFLSHHHHYNTHLKIKERIIIVKTFAGHLDL